MPHPVQVARQALGWSQVELARRASVRRQLVGSVEAGRHAPRVDAALALAGALGESVEQLFSASGDLFEVVSFEDETPPAGAAVVAARVGDRLVYAAVHGAGGMQPWWGLADGVTAEAEVRWFPGARQVGLL